MRGAPHPRRVLEDHRGGSVNITPRKEEVAAVMQLLESGDYATSQDLAKAIIHTVVDLLAGRDAYGVGFGLKTDDVIVPVGPLYHLTDAKSLQKRYEDCGFRAYIAPLLSPVPRGTTEPPKSTCGVCNHAREFHDFRGCWASTKREGRCPCRER